MLRKNHLIDATQGSIIGKIFLYTYPLMLSMLVQTLFNAVDIIVLGNFADNNAVASVGATTTIVHLVVHTFVGLASGTKIILARQYGARDGDAIRKMTDTSLISSVIIGALVAAAGIIFAPDFLHLTKCPTECFDGAVIYIRIYAASAPAIMLYNFGSSVLNASGDTQRPLYYIIAGGVLNAVLNIILCIILPQKVIAVAVATVASQVLGALLVTLRLTRMDTYGKLSLRQMCFSGKSLAQMLRFGLPLALNNALYPFANLQIQSAINLYGVAATAGNSAAATMEGIASSFVQPFGATAATFASQNLGAGKSDRARKSIFHCLWMGITVGALVGVLGYLAAGHLLLPLILGADEVAISFGVIRMFWVNAFYFIVAINSVLGGAVQSHGYSFTTAVNSIVGVLLFRYAWMWWVYPLYETFDCLMACFTVSWTIVMVFNIIWFIFVLMKHHRPSRAVA